MSTEPAKLAEPYELRGRRLYQEDERVKLNPGDAATVNRRQLRAMRDAIGRGRAEGRITVRIAAEELAVLNEVRRRMDREARPIGIRLSGAEAEFSVRERFSADQRRHRKAEKKARAAGRPKKKSKARKRRK